MLDFAFAISLLVRLQFLVQRLAFLVLFGKNVDGRVPSSMVDILGDDGLRDIESEEKDDRDALCVASDSVSFLLTSYLGDQAKQSHPVSPLVRDIEAERRVNVVASGHDRIAGSRAGKGADLIRSQRRRISGTDRCDIDALAEEVDPLEFVAHCRRKGVSGRDNTSQEGKQPFRTADVLDRIKPGQPRQPVVLRVVRDLKNSGPSAFFRPLPATFSRPNTYKISGIADPVRSCIEVSAVLLT